MTHRIRARVRVGAGALALGLSLAGPALGVAAAEGSGPDSTSVAADSPAGPGRDAGPGDSARPGPTRGGNQPAGRGGGVGGDVSLPAQSPAEPGEARRGRINPGRRTAVVDEAPSGGADAAPRAASTMVDPVRVKETPSLSAGTVSTGPLPSAAVPVGAVPGSAAPVARPAPAPPAPAEVVAAVRDLGVLASSPRPAPGAVAAIPAGSQSATPAVAQAVSPTQSFLERAFAPVIMGIGRALDVAGQWLASFPPNPVTDFLAGAVWLVRRTLLPVGDGVGSWGSAGCVSTGDCSGQDLSGADLRGQDLTGVRFTDAKLDRAILGEANLTRADMSGATVLHTVLTNANLTGANLSGVDLKYQNLRGVTLAGANLSHANLTGALLWGRPTTDLATATLVGANFAGQAFSSANGTTLNWAGKDLTGVNLSGANLTGADLSRANLTGAELNGVNLTRANLTDATLPGPGFLSPLVSATLTGANLTNVDLSGADLSGMNLTGVVLAGANLARTKLKSANLTDANLANAILTGADLTDADLTRADLLGSDMLNTTLAGVVWKDTRCSYGNKTSAGCSNAALLSEPPADWLQKASTNGWRWYMYDGSGLDPDLDRVSTPTVRGSQGAPLQNVDFRDSKYDYNYDGIQGVVYNDTGQRIVVRTEYSQYGQSDVYCCAAAILDPGDSVSYQLGGEWFYDDDSYDEQGILQFLRYDNGQTVGEPAQLWLADQTLLQPQTEFYPPGYDWPYWVNRRVGWKEEEQHSEIWGGVNISVKREIDGWRLNGSDTFNTYYPNPNDDATNDWAIFTIRVKSL